jgi:hypothetical protein
MSAMKMIKISDATHWAIADCATLSFRATAKRQSDGSWLVPLDDDTVERLHRARLPGESDDDTIMRMIRCYRSHRPS